MNPDATDDFEGTIHGTEYPLSGGSPVSIDANTSKEQGIILSGMPLIRIFAVEPQIIYSAFFLTLIP